MGKRIRTFALITSAPRREVALSALVIGASLVVGAGSLSSSTTGQSWFVNRMEFNPVDYLESDHGVKFRSDFAPVLFMDKLRASEYLCVNEESVYYPYLVSHVGLTGIVVDSSCSPLDLTNRPGDSLHPKLVTAPIAKSHLYYAFVPGFEPTSNQAILVEAHGDVFVLVNIDTLNHVGIDAQVQP